MIGFPYCRDSDLHCAEADSGRGGGQPGRYLLRGSDSVRDDGAGTADSESGYTQGSVRIEMVVTGSVLPEKAFGIEPEY